MKERVELNNNGRSIESHCKTFIKKKWESRYIVCRIQSDLGDPIVNIYKCRKDRQKDKVKQSIILQSYIGFERSFPLKNKYQTLAVITKDNNIILSFELPETLLQWETWFKNVGGQSTTHYMQLLKFPNQLENSAFVNKEVRCHIHDSRLAIVYGIPAELLIFCDVTSAKITADRSNHRIKIQPLNSNDEYVLSCPSIDAFSKYLEKAICEDGTLSQYLNKKQAEGVWLQNIPTKIKAHDSISHWSDTVSGLFNLMNQPSTSANQSEIFSSRAGINNIGTLRGAIKTPLGSRKIRNNSVFESPESNYVNTILPDYENVENVVKPSVVSNDSIQRKASTMTTPNSQSYAANLEKRFYDMKVAMSKKGRSMMDFSSLPYEETESRHENWKKAKKFISAFSPKSQQDLNRNGRNSKKMKKSSSTSALHYNPVERPEELAATSSMSELEDLPPSLNLAVSNPSNMMLYREHKENEEIPNGLVRVREEGTLKARGGVNVVLARRLASGVNGSYSKYDGERTTHQYQQNSAGREIFIKRGVFPEPRRSETPDPADAIETAVNRERDKMKQSERRASSVSFQKNHQVHLPILSELYKKAIASTVPSGSSYVDTSKTPFSKPSMMSSDESISSDARSKISIKKRSNSPPVGNAPVITPRLKKQKSLTLPKQLSTSIDSLNSQKTTRTASTVKLPTKNGVNTSSSTDISSEESFEKQIREPAEPTELKHPSLSRNSSRRMSEDQGSNIADVVTQVRKGYFRKNNRMRRSHRALDDTSHQFY